MNNLIEPSVLGALAIFILDKLISWFSNKNSKYQDALERNTLALVELETTVKYFEKRLEKLEKLEN